MKWVEVEFGRGVYELQGIEKKFGGEVEKLGFESGGAMGLSVKRIGWGIWV